MTKQRNRGHEHAINMIACSISHERLRRSRELFTVGANGELPVLRFHLESAQLVFEQLLSGFTTFRANIDLQRAELLNRSISYTRERLNELLLRLSFIDWVHRQFLATSQYPSGLWNYYSTLAFNLGLIDQTDLWWPYVKRLRDLIVHREHLRLVFGQPEDGFRLQRTDRHSPNN